MDQAASQVASTEDCAIHTVNCVIPLWTPEPGMRRSKFAEAAARTPSTSHSRLELARHEEALSTEDVLQRYHPKRKQANDAQQSQHEESEPKTFLYLAYGSNLCAETFRGKRGIEPISQVNVVVPEISLTFDLPGLPYSEPCFGNTRYRTPDERNGKPNPTESETISHPPYHKDRWRKGLVGVSYEVTAEDFAHIVATEGGGSAYKLVTVKCYPLPNDARSITVPTDADLDSPEWQTKSFPAYTLFCPPANPPLRKDPSYAQPSARYLKLITDGATEHNFPNEYQTFLTNIRTYAITSNKQRLGSWVFLSIWGPLFGFFFLGGAKLFLNDDGTFPDWLAKIAAALFSGAWASYDGFFFPLFGEGERTLKHPDRDDDDDGNMQEKMGNAPESSRVHHDSRESQLSEKTPLISCGRKNAAIKEMENIV